MSVKISPETRRQVENLYQEASKEPINLKDYTNDLNTQEKQQFRVILHSSIHLFSSIENIILRYLQCTGNLAGTKQIVNIGYTVNHIINGLKNQNIYLSTPDMLQRLKIRMIGYSAFVREFELIKIQSKFSGANNFIQNSTIIGNLGVESNNSSRADEGLISGFRNLEIHQ